MSRNKERLKNYKMKLWLRIWVLVIVIAGMILLSRYM